ncbi:MAG TPA: di-heme oxidoredictase family protein [Terriglobales bacterium]|nr:di-heme oxidoredictase family protein [Terriglobales bacterium]
MMTTKSSAIGLAVACSLLMFCRPAFSQKDPGVRGGLRNTGGGLEQQGIPIPHPPVISPNPTTHATINDNELASFLEGILRAGQLESTCDDCADVTDGSPVEGLGELDPIFPQFHTNSNGLGARHNADQCFACHAQPGLGGSGGFLVPNPGAKKPHEAENPQFSLVPHRYGRQNVVPSFETRFGPIREVRFKRKPDGTPDGGVHQLWTVRGSTNDPTIPNCAITQPDFAAEEKAGNLAFRIPLQMTGLGLIESIQDREIIAQHDATAALRAPLGIGGHPNRSGNDGTITRFGWKAQNKSITIFAGEAYNVEMGITNEAFPTATEEDPDCQGPEKPEPNDVVRTDDNDYKNQWFDNPIHILPDWQQFQMLMRFTDGPAPDPNPSASAQKGKTLFSNIGCALCHTPQMQTAPVMNSAVLQDRPVNHYSDLMVHHMGYKLADDVSQGQAAGDEFRTTPLWGVGQRIFFLHDGRTSDLLQVIREHSSPASPTYPPSEANKVVHKFSKLSPAEQQAILDFLRSL